MITGYIRYRKEHSESEMFMMIKHCSTWLFLYVSVMISIIQASHLDIPARFNETIISSDSMEHCIQKCSSWKQCSSAAYSAAEKTCTMREEQYPGMLVKGVSFKKDLVSRSHVNHRLEVFLQKIQNIHNLVVDFKNLKRSVISLI